MPHPPTCQCLRSTLVRRPVEGQPCDHLAVKSRSTNGSTLVPLEGQPCCILRGNPGPSQKDGQGSCGRGCRIWRPKITHACRTTTHSWSPFLLPIQRHTCLSRPRFRACRRGGSVVSDAGLHHRHCWMEYKYKSPFIAHCSCHSNFNSSNIHHHHPLPPSMGAPCMATLALACIRAAHLSGWGQNSVYS